MATNYDLNYDSIEIDDNTVLGYDDIEIRANAELQQYYFLVIGFDARERVVFYDMNSGLRVTSDELKGFAHMDKKVVLEDGKSYRVGDLKTLYNFMNESKVNHSFGNK
ncbi:MAG: hypothetical protein K2G03_06100 [Bacilli bacterium]|nr:hypothetical protein [Bacilli bacterium]